MGVKVKQMDVPYVLRIRVASARSGIVIAVPRLQGRL
jgi:hypothetical protein